LAENGEKSLAAKLDDVIEKLTTWHRITLVMVIIGLLSLSVVISVSQFHFSQEIARHGQIVNVVDETTGQEGLAFVPRTEQIFSAESILELHTTQLWLMASNGLVIGLLSFLFFWITYRGHAYKKELKSIENQLIRQSYLVNFETSIPEGQNREEKIINHSALVFPELQRLKTKQKISYKTNQSIGSHTVDVLVSTRRGDFVVKFFEHASLKTLEEFCSSLSGKRFFRVLCVSKNFDDDVSGPHLSEMIERLGFDLDLIFEEDAGYSMLWVS
jgi:hypothetical protein